MRIPATVLLLALANLAHAQMEEVVVTGSRINGDDYSRMPAITVTKQADFLIRSIKLTYDTRSEAGRTDELHQAFKDLLASASRRPKFSMAYREDLLMPITANEYKIQQQINPSPTTVRVNVVHTASHSAVEL